MEVFVDDRRMEAELVASGPTIEDALRHARLHWFPDRMVMNFRCDGADAVSDLLPKMLSRHVDSVERLELFTATRQTLVSNAMLESETTLADTEQGCRRISELLSEGRLQDAMQSLGDCMRAWQQLHLAVSHSAKMLKVDLDSATIEGEALVDVIARPREALLQIRNALTAQDYVLLADILQYEMGDVFSRWFTLIRFLKQEARSSEE